MRCLAVVLAVALLVAAHRGSGTQTADVTGPATPVSIALTSPVLSLESCAGNVRDIDLRLTR